MNPRDWRGVLLAAALVGGAAGGLVLAGCGRGPSGSPSAAGTTTSGPVTTTTLTSAAPSTSPVTTSTTSPDAPLNEVADADVKSGLTAAYVAHTGLPADQVAGPGPGSVYDAYVPATKTYWAIANFVPTPTASYQTKVSMQDDGCCGVFTEPPGTTSWTFVAGYLGLPCPGEVPADVMSLWNLQTGSDCASTTTT